MDIDMDEPNIVRSGHSTKITMVPWGRW